MLSAEGLKTRVPSAALVWSPGFSRRAACKHAALKRVNTLRIADISPAEAGTPNPNADGPAGAFGFEDASSKAGFLFRKPART